VLLVYSEDVLKWHLENKACCTTLRYSVD